MKNTIPFSFIIFGVLGLVPFSSIYSQCGDGSSGTGCTGAGGNNVGTVTTVNTASLNTWNTLTTTNLQPNWIFQSVARGTVIRFATCSGRDAEIYVTGPAGFTNIIRDADNEFNVGLGCTPGGLDESFYLYCPVDGNYTLRFTQNGCVNFTNPTTMNLYWNVTLREPGFGANTWNVHGYDGNDVNLGTGAFYRGFYTESALSYNSTARWATGNSPSNASGWAGCTTVGADNHTVVSKRTGVPSNGVYSVSVSQHDDNYQFYVGGTNVNESGYCCMVHTDVYAGYMDNTTNLEMRHADGGGGSNQGLTFTQQYLSATVNKTDLAENAVCNGNTGTITFSNPTGAVASPVFRSNFSAGTGVTVSGSASVTAGYLQLTPAANSQYGGAIFANSTNCNASVFRAEFDYRIFDGGGADGISFNYADMSGSPVNSGEGGFGAGLSVCFVTYSGAGGPLVYLRYGGSVISGNYGVSLRDANFRKVVITVNNSNQLSLSIAGSAVITNFTLPAGFQSTDKTNWQFSMAGRTGGVNDAHRVDNLVINAYNQYEYSIDGASWNNTGLFTGLAAGTYTPRIRNKAFTAYPQNLADVTITQPAAPNQGTENTYGTNEWYVSCYNTASYTGYRGFYKSTRTNEYNVGADGMGVLQSPDNIAASAGVTAYSGCSIGDDNWSFKARRQGWPCGIYQVIGRGHDDGVVVNVDADNNGSNEYNVSYSCCSNGAFVNQVLYTCVLDASSKVEIALSEGGGNAFVDVDFNQLATPAVNGGTIGGITVTTMCDGGDPGAFTSTAAASGGTVGYNNGGSFTYDWEVSTTSSSSGYSSLGVSTLTYDPGALTTGPGGTVYYFRRKATDKCGTVGHSNSVQIVVVADPVLPSLTVATPANGTSICTGANPSATFFDGSGGAFCTASYQYSIDGGGAWSAYTPGVTTITAGAGGTTVIIQGKRDCTGVGCDGAAETFTTLVSWPVVAQPVAGTLTPNITSGSTVCTGQSLSATSAAGSGGVSPTDELEFSTGGAFSAYISGNSISTASLAGQTVTIRTRRTSSGSGCTNSGYNQVSWTVVADPVAQTITPTPAAGAICESASVSATFSGGSGGTGTVADVYEFSTNGGGSWAAYTSGNAISAAGLAGQTIKIRTRRTATGSGCDNSAYNEVSWPVNVTSAITSATAAASPICPAATTTLTANGVVGTSTTTTWWSGAGGTGTNYGTGATTVQGPGTYYARVTGTCGNAEASVTVGAKTESVAATSTTATRPSGCAGETATLTASGHTLGTGATINWYTATGGGGTNIGAGASQTDVPSASTTYYARIVGDCNTVETNTGLVVIGAVNNIVLAEAATEGTESNCDAGAWTYYESNNNAREGKYIFAIRWNGASEKGTEAVTITTAATPWSATGSVTVAGVTAPGGSWAMPRYWNVTINGSHGATLSQPVDVRFYYDPAEITATEAARDAYVTANSGAGTVSEGNVWFKTQGVGFDPANMTANSIVGGSQPLWVLTPTFGTENGISYAQFDGLTSFSGGGFGSGAGVPGGTPLPIELAYFKGTKVNEASALLEWATATENDNDYFVVERSGDGVNFQEIGVVDGAGNSSVARTYRFSDNNPLAGDNYYRLRQVDFNGASTYSHVVALNFEKDFSVNVFPNPFNDKFSVDIYTEHGSDATIEVFDMAGRLVQNIQRGILSGYNRIDIDGDALVHGSYMVRVVAGDKVVTSTVVKNR